ncbi:hypothetical protein BD779DRAFT_1525528 [Infundibulicybe gibba]|nr:hypothetical protein BD779DRAFT_1525528 [Infundibulicybe gibba]
MAQALFDEHPLQQYLRDAGETPELMMPGSSAQLAFELDPAPHSEADLDDGTLDWIPPFISNVLELLESISPPNHPSNRSNPFVERFKYDVISSSLLASSLATPYPRRRSLSPSLPGKLILDHSRKSSVDVSPTPLSTVQSAPYWGPSLVLALIVVLFSAGYNFLGVSSIAGAIFLLPQYKCPDGTLKPDMTQPLESLAELITASDAWDSIFQEAMSVLESDERSIMYGPTTPNSPSSSLRVALHTSLHTTQTQCDDIRHLLSALTCPSELSQLSEMYAPPSPTKTTFSTQDLTARPLSLPVSRRRTSSTPSDPSFIPQNKRSTWNGSYSSLANAGSPPMQVLKRREKRRSDLSALLQVSPSSRSAPVTPTPESPSLLLSGVMEEVDAEEDTYFGDSTNQFGTAALDLQRERKVNGIEALAVPPPSYQTSVSHPPRAPRTPTSSISSASRFTSIQTTRHSLSLSALSNALQGALASKRYACSHLLALRFTDDEDDGYWEDVQSVMGLLTTTLADAASRLTAALEDTEQRRVADETPTPPFTGSRAGSMSPIRNDGVAGSTKRSSMQKGPRRNSDLISFAPMPNHITRFAAHVSAISSALDDAREHLEESECEALQAYERLRRELGVALRECERGRQRLIDIISPPPNPHEDESEDLDDTPALGHDASDSLDSIEAMLPRELTSIDEGHLVETTPTNPGSLDDVTAHLLLMASSEHLPPPGIEQVFEAEMDNGPISAREKPKLSREERIKLRLTFGSESPASNKRGPEKWGPGGEVVQELKDVIWKVGEKRRKMAENIP